MHVYYNQICKSLVSAWLQQGTYSSTANLVCVIRLPLCKVPHVASKQQLQQRRHAQLGIE